MKIEIQKQDKTEIVSQKEIEKKKTFLGTIYPHKGHKLYEFSTKENTLIEAEYKKEPLDYSYLSQKVNGLKKSVIVKEDCIYISSLNKKNAEKILLKRYGIKI